MLTVLVVASGLLVHRAEYVYAYGPPEVLAGLQVTNGTAQPPYPAWPTGEWRALIHPTGYEDMLIAAPGPFRVVAAHRWDDCDHCEPPPPDIGNPCGWACGYVEVAWGSGVADFNGDGDVGTDSDIEAFFACIAGVCCPHCTADIDADGSVTDGDIELFFRILGGG